MTESKKQAHPGQGRKFLLSGGPYDGVKVTLYPDPTITPQGKRWAWNDLIIKHAGLYEMISPLPDKMPTLYWKET